MEPVIEMFRDAPGSSTVARFSCSLNAWELLRELGETFGWRPKGATYVAPPGRKIAARAQHNYQPGDFRDRKWIDADDAHAWADALRIARRSSHLNAMIEARTKAGGGGDSEEERNAVLALIDRFVDFSADGAFAFAVAPPPLPPA